MANVWRNLLIWRRPSLGAMILAAGLTGTAMASDFDPTFIVRGFGTFGETYSDAKNADLVGSIIQPNGAGATRPWAPGVDSKAGVQANLQLDQQLSLVVQGVAQHQYDDTYRPALEWAYVKWDPTTDFSLRAGRLVAPIFMLSDARFVGYSYLWVRPPAEIYEPVPFTNLDGITGSYHFQFEDYSDRLSASFGDSHLQFPNGGETGTRRGLVLLSDTIETGAFTFRLGYGSFMGRSQSTPTNSLFGGLTQFGQQAGAYGFSAAANQALSSRDQYQLKRFSYTGITAGAKYDAADWIVMGEWAKLRSEGLIYSGTTGYLTVGRRFGAVTPYATAALASATPRLPQAISLNGLPAPLAYAANQLNMGLDAAIRNFSLGQHSFSVGARYDFMRNVDLKAQYTRQLLAADSNGLFANVQRDFVSGSKINSFGVTVDFVF